MVAVYTTAFLLGVWGLLKVGALATLAAWAFLKLETRSCPAQYWYLLEEMWTTLRAKLSHDPWIPPLVQGNELRQLPVL